MGLFKRLADKLEVNEGTPIDPSGTHAVLAMTSDVYHEGAWVTLPAGKVEIDYQVNMISQRNQSPHLEIPFAITIRTADGATLEISRPFDDHPRAATIMGIGNAYTRRRYGKVEIPAPGHYFIQASGQQHKSGEPHLRFA